MNEVIRYSYWYSTQVNKKIYIVVEIFIPEMILNYNSILQAMRNLCAILINETCVY